MSIVVLAGCVSVVALAAAFAGYTIGAGRTPPTEVATFQHEELEPPAAMPSIEIIEPPVPAGSIAVPGFERLTVRGRMLQADGISNPANNACYFVVSLSLADGSEIYRSGVLAPGQSVGIVELPNALTPGTYEGGTARYSAYSLENLLPLNGADISFTLEVTP